MREADVQATLLNRQGTHLLNNHWAMNSEAHAIATRVLSVAAVGTDDSLA
jgi:hypothetical protein